MSRTHGKHSFPIPWTANGRERNDDLYASQDIDPSNEWYRFLECLGKHSHSMEIETVDRLRGFKQNRVECSTCTGLTLYRFHDGAAERVKLRRALAVIYTDSIWRIGNYRTGRRNSNTIEMGGIANPRYAEALAKCGNQRRCFLERLRTVERADGFRSGGV